MDLLDAKGTYALGFNKADSQLYRIDIDKDEKDHQYWHYLIVLAIINMTFLILSIL